MKTAQPVRTDDRILLARSLCSWSGSDRQAIEIPNHELLLCHGTVCVVGKMRALILQLSKSSIYSTMPYKSCPEMAGQDHISILQRIDRLTFNSSLSDI
ncbi:TPA: hypothetical protein I3798_004249 [Enterobacter cloacae]|nr:hypothetical protein [Klebsiella quasipneumoniae]MBX4510239.1 hypothetical protein [Klebsiella oxytoca]HAS1116084.1 hypothetical protein [Enterobacter cloacae]HDK6480249.1 hypothetical protein [Klebsiella variicola]HDY8803018.1 hypothetical protein [Klebsiella pneumoniae]WQN11925.1 hypothetical protein RMP71_10280 [Klebsiella quasipneumoniae]